jgi:hypothetical protein
METFLILGSNLKIKQDVIETLKKQFQVHANYCYEYQSETSVGIDMIRNIRKSLLVGSGTVGNRMIIIHDFDTATFEAQNAFLKILEEPPVRTIIVLTAKSKNLLLSTVLSRCQIIQSQPNNSVSKSGENSPETQLLDLKRIMAMSPGERLQEASLYTKTREDALKYTDHMTDTIHCCLHNHNLTPELSPQTLTILLSKTLAARQYLKANVSVKATIDILLLGFPRQKFA